MNADIASRVQFPIKVAYGLTIHKSQGMSLDNVIVDCRFISCPGQLGVALGRAKDVYGLQVNAFQEKHVISQPDAVGDFYAADPLALREDLSCCRTPLTLPDDEPRPEPHGIFDGPAEEIETADEDHDLIDLDLLVTERVVATDRNISAIDYRELISSTKYEYTVTDLQSTVNELLDGLMVDVQNVETFCKVQIDHLQELYQEGTERNLNQGILNAFYGNVQQHMTGELYTREVQQILFNTSDLTDGHSHAAFRIFTNIRTFFLKEKENKITVAEDQNRRALKADLSAIERGKVRYVGGHCVAKIKYHLTSSLRRLANSISSEKRAIIQNIQYKLDILDIIIRSQSQITQETSDKESLSVTNVKQNLRCGLTHITDTCLDFFTKLCSCTLDLQSRANLNKFGEDMFEANFADLKRNDELWEMFYMMFTSEMEYRPNCELVIRELFQDLVLHFLKIMMNQFRKDYLQDKHTEKKDAHRKQVLKRTNTQHVSFDDITSDTSHNKVNTHTALVAYVSASNTLPKSFTKLQLQSLCDAYQVTYKNETKPKLIEKLCEALGKVDAMPHPEVFPSSSKSTRVETRKSKRGTPVVGRDLCKACRQRGDDDADWVLCNYCDCWFHRFCAEIFDDDEWAEYCKPGVKFRCHSC